jgi:Na+-translocating ferredoxin:NAD+ oxidoreductase RNF subunit RnfB
MAGKLGGQRIETDLNKCIGCGKCNDSCKMGIDIMSFAKQQKAVETWRCVGCDCCVIACPKQCLRFTTRFTRKYLNKK